MKRLASGLSSSWTPKAALCGLALVSGLACAGEPGMDDEQELFVPVQAVPAVASDFRVRQRLFGEVVASRQVEILAPVSGRVRYPADSAPLQTGRWVAADAVLFELVSEDLETVRRSRRGVEGVVVDVVRSTETGGDAGRKSHAPRARR